MTQQSSGPHIPGGPGWHQKPSMTWPIWAALGALVLVILGLALSRGGVPDWAKAPPGPAQPVEGMEATPVQPKPVGPPRKPKAGERVDAMTLYVASTYQLSGEAALCPTAGADRKLDNPDNKKLTAGCMITVIRSQMAGNTKWYQVHALDGKGGEIADGWVSCMWLDGQTLKYVPDDKLPSPEEKTPAPEEKPADK